MQTKAGKRTKVIKTLVCETGDRQRFVSHAMQIKVSRLNALDLFGLMKMMAMKTVHR